MKKTVDYITKTGKSALGFGAMRLPGDDETAKMVDAYIDSGEMYFDTAYIYEGSEERLKRTLVQRHIRDSYFVANKLPPWEINQRSDRDKIFETQLKRMGLDYFDYYLVHSLDESREKSIEEFELFEYVSKLKEKGHVRHIGFSFHGGTACLDRLLTKYKMSEFVQLQLNYVDILRGPAGQWQAVANKHGVPIIVMEPVKGGTLAKLPESAEKLLMDYDSGRSIASWAIQYAANLEGATCILSGMSNLEQTIDNIKTFKNLRPLTAEEMGLIEKVLGEMSKVSSIPCTACRYCVKDCPMEIDIAACFSLYNELKRGSEAWNRKIMFNTMQKNAKHCTGCGACLSHCPQHIDIPKEMAVVAKEFS